MEARTKMSCENERPTFGDLAVGSIVEWPSGLHVTLAVRAFDRAFKPNTLDFTFYNLDQGRRLYHMSYADDHIVLGKVIFNERVGWP